MARTKPADERRDDLLDAAEAAFVEHGIAATTVTEITTRAGVAKGTFYLYFESRTDLVAAVQQRYGQRFVKRVTAALDAAGDDWTAKLDAFVRAGLADHREGQRLHDVLFADWTPSPEDHLHDADRIVAVLRELIEAGVAAGAYSIDDPATGAMLLFNTLHGVYDAFWIGTTPPDDDVLIDAAQQIFRRAVGLEAARPASPRRPAADRRRTPRRSQPR